MKDTVAFEALHGSITTLIYIYKTGKKRAFSILHTPPIRVRITPSTGVPQHRLKRKKGSTHHAKPVIGYRDTLEAVPYASRRNLLIKTQCPRRKRGSSPYLGNPHHASWQEKHAGHGTTANNCKHGQLHSQIKQKTLKEAKNQCFIDRKGKGIPQNYVNLQSYAIALQSRKNRKTGKSRTDCGAAPSGSKPPHPTEMASPHAA